MRLPWPRLTLRRLMILIALIATFTGLGAMIDRRMKFGRNASKCTALALMETVGAARAASLAEKLPGQSAGFLDEAARCNRRAAYFRRWAHAWRDASDCPWRATPIPGPVPN